jgi:hypothetical protein
MSAKLVRGKSYILRSIANIDGGPLGKLIPLFRRGESELSGN